MKIGDTFTDDVTGKIYKCVDIIVNENGIEVFIFQLA